MPSEPGRRDADDARLAIGGAIMVLSNLKEAADGLPPLKVLASGALGILECVKVSFRCSLTGILCEPQHSNTEVIVKTG